MNFGLPIVALIVLGVAGIGVWGLIDNARKRGAAEERNKVDQEDLKRQEEDRARTEKVAEQAANPPSDADTLGRLRNGEF